MNSNMVNHHSPPVTPLKRKTSPVITRQLISGYHRGDGDAVFSSNYIPDFVSETVVLMALVRSSQGGQGTKLLMHRINEPKYLESFAHFPDLKTPQTVTHMCTKKRNRVVKISLPSNGCFINPRDLPMKTRDEMLKFTT